MARAYTHHKASKNMLVKVGIRIRQLREEQNLTIETLADKAGISSKYLQKVETAKYSFSLSILCRITEALDMSLVDFFISCELPRTALNGVWR